eukprot:GDKI01034313.1.p1 GENE.GDKI01034313.1~~GDKI01034313.1.p1  ORF type:complete len:343 (-),score=112.50 GDKI01034313.1:311-1339(-)
MYKTSIRLQNAIAIPRDNRWELTLTVGGVEAVKSNVDGYKIDEMQASAVGPSTVGRAGSVILSFQSSKGLPNGGTVGVYAPVEYVLSCSSVNLGNLPAGSTCSEEVSPPISIALDRSTGAIKPGQLYYFTLLASNPIVARINNNVWGVTLKSRSGLVSDANLGIPGWQLTAFDLRDFVVRPQTVQPSAANAIQVEFYCDRIEASTGNYITLSTPPSFRVAPNVCASFHQDVPDSVYRLAVDPTLPTDCQESMVRINLDPAKAQTAAKYAFRVTVTNPPTADVFSVWTLNVYKQNTLVATVPLELNLFNAQPYEAMSNARDRRSCGVAIVSVFFVLLFSMWGL